MQKIPEVSKVEGKYDAYEVLVDGEPFNLEKSLKVVNHSPTGFAWGYLGSGPNQTALAIMLRFLPVDKAQLVYEKFKFDHVAAWPESDFVVDVELRQWIEKALHETN